MLRPEPGNARTVARLASHGIAAIAAPLFRIDPVAPDMASSPEPDALLVTSANAAIHGRAVFARYAGLPVYAVGEQTADPLPATIGACHLAPDGTAQSAIDLARADGVRRLLHVAGADVRPVDTGPVAIDRITVYHSVAVNALPPALIARWPDLRAIMVHSPRAGAMLDRLVAAHPALDRNGITLIAISRTAADASASGWQGVAIAATPDDIAMLAIARKICQ